MQAKKRSVIAELSSGELGYLVTEVRNHLLAGIERELSPLQITAAQFVVLNSIVSGKGRTLSEFCKLLGYDSGAMTRLLDRIEAKGIIRRVENPADRRSYLVELTEQGKAVFPQARQGTQSAFRRMLAGFSEDDAEALRGLLHRILANTAEA
ncbi:MarR family winged helix-turn-helix transcriptional regulator [Cupriavidus neocaledonicus]|uniref:Multiple antibiotic resistance protein MarR n=1 Tax=Cupriavidus neocaledonicus TaxID=1040979 RepID=A0A375H8B2_9BURK|nr:MarR family transcriptional regulator [Cupriavidus neocaledonicus]SOZ34612.1 Multiple antibiotic resistance protein MarR [Cupriavidus neocaledonicus]SPD46440.1 Multiple antibiotic resistance protein MarR [Cupriavidus neocaledonicus]